MIINLSHKKANINYEVVNKGENIIFLHGWGGNLETFFPIARLLPYRSYLVDLPGFGRSSQPKVPWSTQEYADAIIEFVNTLNLNNVTIVGHSFGGKIALEVAFKNPEWLKGLVLVASAGLRLKKTKGAQAKEIFYKISKEILKFLPKNCRERLLDKLKSIFGSKDYKNVTGIMREILVKSVNDDLKEKLYKIVVPTLLIWGENDTIVPVVIGKEFNNRITNSKLVILKNAGHFPYLENMIDFLEELKVFLREVYKYA